MKTKIIENWAKAQKAGAWLPCPRCGKLTMKESLTSNAFSRRADIYICDKCGMIEAIEDIPYDSNAIFGYPEKLPLEAWFIFKNVYNQPYYEKRGDDGWNVDINRRIYLLPEDIDAIVGTALDGGITYWCNSAKIGEEAYLGKYASDQISRGGTLILHDAEDNKDHILDLESLLTGFVTACKKNYGNCLEWFSGDSIDTAKIDAEAADVIIQCGLFGDVVYG